MRMTIFKDYMETILLKLTKIQIKMLQIIKKSKNQKIIQMMILI